ncbi:MAG TPA: hypothetical protein VF491_20295 [Vicinamibacterales bacterium]|jgi:hypothetical protein
MRVIPSACLALAVASLVLFPKAAAAQAQPDARALQEQIDQLKKEFGERIAALEAKLATASAAPVQAVTPAAVSAPEAAPIVQAPASAAKVFNPDMAVIGNFLGAAGRNTVNPSPALQMKEAEASFQAVVDPYARADFFMSFGEEGVELEEGFITLTELPGQLQAKAGKMRAAFGKVNTLHTHAVPWADRPLVTQNLVGGEEGISDAGVSLARLIPNPWIFLEATGQVFRGDAAGGELYKSSTPGDLSYVGRLRGYHDLTESTNLDLGFSISHGHNASGVVDDIDIGRYTTQLYGFDATLRWRPLARAIYHQFVARSEMVWSHRDQPNGLQQASGLYVSADYQFARRWFGGGRLDWSDHADEASVRDRGQSFVLTYLPSEFSQLRGQYRRTAYGNGPVANEFLMQLQFAIGAHGAHPF